MSKLFSYYKTNTKTIMKGRIYRNIFSAFTADLSLGLESSGDLCCIVDDEHDEHDEHDEYEGLDNAAAAGINSSVSSWKGLKSKLALSAFPFFLFFPLTSSTTCCLILWELFLQLNISQHARQDSPALL